jgi:hypothetical protein
MSRSRSTNDTGQQTEQLFVKGGLCFRVVRGDMQDVIHIHVHVVERCQSSRVQFIRTFNIMQRRRRRRRRSKVTVTSVVVVVLLLVVFSSVCFRLSEALLELFLHHLVKPRDSHYDVRVYIFSRKRAACLFLSLSLSLSLCVCVCIYVYISFALYFTTWLKYRRKCVEFVIDDGEFLIPGDFYIACGWSSPRVTKNALYSSVSEKKRRLRRLLLLSRRRRILSSLTFFLSLNGRRQ